MTQRRKPLNLTELTEVNQKLKAQLEELQETFRAIRHDEVDALIINTPRGDRVFTLRGADQSYRVLVEQMKEGAAMLSRDVQTVLYANTSLAAMLKRPLEKIVGSSIREHIAPPHLTAFEELLKQSRKGKNKISGEIELQTRDGRFVPIVMSLNNITIEGAEATYVVVTDLTEHMEDEVKRYTDKLETEIRRITEALKDAERMAAIGQTAGMVGHDIRNPLQTIVGELYLAKEALRQIEDSKAKLEMAGILDRIEEQVTYIEKIVADLQDFAKPLKPQPRQTNLEKLVEETLRTINIPNTVKISVRIHKSLPDLVIDPDMMQRVLTNLFINSVQAIPGKGEIRVEAKQTNDCTLISVKDNGLGIADENKPNVFRPLFTTKAKGQGFGLAVVKRLVEAQNAEITFHSERNKGTEFIIRLPSLKE